eukprot:3479589-Rhodomonas_salina.1
MRPTLLLTPSCCHQFWRMRAGGSVSKLRSTDGCKVGARNEHQNRDAPPKDEEKVLVEDSGVTPPGARLCGDAGHGTVVPRG